jgi:hypothetical protein
VVSDEATLFSLGIASDMKEKQLRESLMVQNQRAKKEQVIIRNIRHIGNEIAGISSKVCCLGLNTTMLLNCYLSSHFTCI